VLEDQKYADGHGSEVAAELRRRGYGLKKHQEAMEGVGREKLEKINVTDPEEGQPEGDPAQLQWPDSSG
jgi:hypothetical protein